MKEKVVEEGREKGKEWERVGRGEGKGEGRGLTRGRGEIGRGQEAGGGREQLRWAWAMPGENGGYRQVGKKVQASREAVGLGGCGRWGEGRRRQRAGGGVEGRGYVKEEWEGQKGQEREDGGCWLEEEGGLGGGLLGEETGCHWELS
jgi:hypothetical protein